MSMCMCMHPLAWHVTFQNVIRSQLYLLSLPDLGDIGMAGLAKVGRAVPSLLASLPLMLLARRWRYIL